MDTLPVQRAPITIQMSYHDNEVEFRGPDSSVRGFRFTVNEFSITPGQDPDGKNKAGDVKGFNGNEGKFTFVVGRKNNSSVASWWTQRFRPWESTFNHDPENLNFAFRGKLEISVLQGGNVTGYVIENVGLAQGHTGTLANNWWFAAKGAVGAGDKNISVEGSDPSGRRATFTFLRGRFSAIVNSVELVAIRV